MLLRAARVQHFPAPAAAAAAAVWHFRRLPIYSLHH
jgi:hypothetical protein